jgi:hypothetical protein
METRRLEGRFLCADLVRLDWRGEDGPNGVRALRSEQALLEDISPQGGCVQLEEPVPEGTAIMLTVGSTPFYGHVCYCVFRDDGYFVGLRFAEENMWSAGMVRPQHLLSLCELGLAAQASLSE